MKKIAMFAFNGEFMCFIHVLLNAIGMNEKGYDVKIVIEGAATKLVPELAKEDNPMYRLYEKAKGLDLIDGACKACSNKMGTLEAVQAEGLRLLDEMSGHPSMARYREEGFEIITF
ncbi:MAG: cytoplasmic protein [Thermodesulfobacteriota bacterium]|nr:cytoplasmic protein [Thermodesulfobacteriota bacterium]